MGEFDNPPLGLTALAPGAKKKLKVGTRCCASATVKLNTDAEHRVPTRSDLDVIRNFFTAPPERESTIFMFGGAPQRHLRLLRKSPPWRGGCAGEGEFQPLLKIMLAISEAATEGRARLAAERNAGHPLAESPQLLRQVGIDSPAKHSRRLLSRPLWGEI